MKGDPGESGGTSGQGTPEQSHANILGGAEPGPREGRPKGRKVRGLGFPSRVCVAGRVQPAGSCG